MTAYPQLIVPVVILLGTLGYMEVRRIHRKGGDLYRRERRRMCVLTTYMCGLLLLPPLYMGLGAVTYGWPMLFAWVWPIALILIDVGVCLRALPSQEKMETHITDTRASGSILVGAVFAAGILLSILNKTTRGHSAITAKIMLVGVMGVISVLLPVPIGTGDMTWVTFAIQRVALHTTIGLFILATLLAANPSSP